LAEHSSLAIVSHFLSLLFFISKAGYVLLFKLFWKIPELRSPRVRAVVLVLHHQGHGDVIQSPRDVEKAALPFFVKKVSSKYRTFSVITTSRALDVVVMFREGDRSGTESY
jgi:hypothetical protein